MGNTSQCSFLSNTDQQYQYLGDQNHFMYGEIKHFKDQKDSQHFAIKKIKFQSENKSQKFRQFIQLYQQISDALHLIKAAQYRNPKAQPQQKKDEKPSNKQNQNSQPIFQCNKDNLVFTSATEQLSCSQPSYSLTLNLEYLQERCSLQSTLKQKSQNLRKSLQSNKVNQNILLELQNRVKMCEYQKIDRLPPKQRSMINMFFSEIQVLRILDYMLTALYGLKINDVKVDAVTPELFFRSLNNQQISYFCPQILNMNNTSNFNRSYQAVKKWLNEENALFHHNWNLKQRQLISYIHPDHLQKLSEHLINQTEQNFVDFNNALCCKELQKQNIFAVGLIMLEICLIQPQICTKIYHVSTCKSQQKPSALAKKQVKYIFEKKNLTLKLNHSIVQKYLIQIKTRYSDQFAQLVEFMVFGHNYNPTKNKQCQSSISYETVIQKLALLTRLNIENLKSVYNCTNKPKSKSKQPTQKQSRKSSLSRQVSVSGVSNPSLSSSSSLSFFPVQSQQKILSVELLKKNCKKIQNKIENMLIKSQLQTLHESFAKKQDRLQELISKDESRILSQLNRLNNEKNVGQKNKRFGYRNIEEKQVNIDNISKNDISQYDNARNFEAKLNQAYEGYKISFPSTLSIKNLQQSQEKQKRINSTTKIKKTILQKARQEQNMGNSVCQTIYLNKQRNTDQQKNSNSTINNETVLIKIDSNMPRNVQYEEVQPFYQVPSQAFSSKTELKNLITIKNKNSMMTKQHSNGCLNGEQKSPKELKSKQLYQMYLKQYKHLVQNQKLVSS